MEEADDLMSDFYPSVVPQPEAVMEAPAVSVNSGAMSKVATRSLSAPAPMQDQAGYANSGDQFERFDDANVKLTSVAPGVDILNRRRHSVLCLCASCH